MITAGTKLGPYEIVAPLGTGGMGEVYLREIRGLGQNPEMKSSWAQMARSGKKVMQFLSEGRYVANVVDGKVTFYGERAGRDLELFWDPPSLFKNEQSPLTKEANSGTLDALLMHWTVSGISDTTLPMKTGGGRREQCNERLSKVKYGFERFETCKNSGEQFAYWVPCSLWTKWNVE